MLNGGTKLLKTRPPGFSPLICLRTANSSSISTGRGLSRNAFSHDTGTRGIRILNGKYDSALNCSKIRQGSRFVVLSRRSSSSVATAIADVPMEERSHDTRSTPSDKDERLEKLTVKELKELLAARSLKTSGLKAELIERLRNAGSLPVNEGQS